jgi:hypothetical protein
MAIQKRGSNLGANKALGANEAVDAGTETALHVLEIGFDSAGAYADVQVETEGIFAGGDPKMVAVARGKDGAVLGRTLISTDSDYPFFGLVSVETPVVGRGRIRMPSAGPSTEVSFEVHRNVQTADPPGPPTAKGQAYLLSDLSDTAGPPPDTGSGDVDGALSSAAGLVDSLTTAALFAGAAYVATPFIEDFISDE